MLNTENQYLASFNCCVLDALYKVATLGVKRIIL